MQCCRNCEICKYCAGQNKTVPQKKKLRRIRVFDRRIKVTVILTSAKNTKKPPRKINSPV